MTSLSKFGANASWRKRGEKDDSPTLVLVHDALDSEFGFNFDPCPLNPEGMRAFDGFGGEWGTRTYVNPPWSKCASWVAEALRQHERGKLVVMFLPANISSLWFCDLVWPNATEVRIVKGKLTPASTIVVIFNPEGQRNGSPKISIWNPKTIQASGSPNLEGHTGPLSSLPPFSHRRHE